MKSLIISKTNHLEIIKELLKDGDSVMYAVKRGTDQIGFALSTVKNGIAKQGTETFESINLSSVTMFYVDDFVAKKSSYKTTSEFNIAMLSLLESKEA